MYSGSESLRSRTRCRLAYPELGDRGFLFIGSDRERVFQHVFLAAVVPQAGANKVYGIRTAADARKNRRVTARVWRYAQSNPINHRERQTTATTKFSHSTRVA